MKKESIDFKKLNSTKKCVDCDAYIKAGILIKNPGALRCRKHHILHDYPPKRAQVLLGLDKKKFTIELARYKMLMGDSK